MWYVLTQEVHHLKAVYLVQLPVIARTLDPTLDPGLTSFDQRIIPLLDYTAV